MSPYNRLPGKVVKEFGRFAIFAERDGSAVFQVLSAAVLAGFKKVLDDFREQVVGSVIELLGPVERPLVLAH